MAKNKQYMRNSGQNKGYRNTGEGNVNDPMNEGTGDDTLVDIVDVKEQAQSFFEKNQTAVLGTLVGLILLAGAYLAYKYGYQAPREKAGMEALYKAENQFKKDSFALALTNPGGDGLGFLDIIEDYSGTKASNLASYYAGVSYLNLGNYDVAVQYLSDYNANDVVTPITKYGAMGDAYAELGDFDKAKSSYESATSSDNEFLTPYYLNKLGVLNMKQGDTDAAIKNFEKIQESYPASNEARDAKKYVTMLKAS